MAEKMLLCLIFNLSNTSYLNYAFFVKVVSFKDTFPGALILVNF